MNIPAAKLHASALLDDEIAVGRDILDVLTSGMYVEPLTVFREYIQNAADAVDTARAAGTLPQDAVGEVAITIDTQRRSIRIADNGQGISNADFSKRLAALGGSIKRGTKARGFRGIGRLVGLAYARQLVFRSRSTGDALVKQMVWDAEALKRLRGGIDDNIRDAVHAIVSVSELTGDDYPEHFFEVELIGVQRLRGDPLLNTQAISDYLSQIAPVPFSPHFTFGDQIAAFVKKHVGSTTLAIRISGQTDIIRRPQQDRFLNGERKEVLVDEIEFFEIPDVDGEIGAAGWILHHQYEGALSVSTLQKGLRLRSGDLQVGGTNLLENEFPETRFNGWTIGEIHVVDRRLIPNARRDHYEQNAHYNNLVNHISPLLRDIAKRCRTSSKDRSTRSAPVVQGVDGAFSVTVSPNFDQPFGENVALNPELHEAIGDHAKAVRDLIGSILRLISESGIPPTQRKALEASILQAANKMA